MLCLRTYWWILLAIPLLLSCGLLKDSSADWDFHPGIDAIRMITPSVGSVSGGTQVSILSNLSEFTSSTTVTVGGESCLDLTVVTPYLIRCLTPPGSVLGKVDVEIGLESGRPVLSRAFTYSPLTGRWSTNGTVKAIHQNAADGSTYLGGTFTRVSSATSEVASKIAKISFDGEYDQSFGLSGFNGTVRAVARFSDGSILIGGDFTSYRGKPANYIAKLYLDGELDETFHPSSGPQGFNGPVHAIAVTSEDEAYIGGSFTSYRSLRANYVAKVDVDGTLNETFNPQSGNNGTDGAVYSFLVYGSYLYIGGSFTQYRGASVGPIAKVDSNGASTGFVTGINAGGVIYGMAIYSGSLIAVGNFTNTYSYVDADGDPQSFQLSHIDMFNAISGSGLKMCGTTWSFNGNVSVLRSVPNALLRTVLVTSNNEIYVGGDTTAWSVNGVNYNANAITKIKTDLLGGKICQPHETFNPNAGDNGANGSVYSLVEADDAIYIGGAFSTYRGSVANHIAKVNTSGELDSSFHASSSSHGTDNAVRALLELDESLYLGGDFTSYGGISVANNLARFLPSGDVDTTFSPQTGSNGTDTTVNTIFTNASAVYVGGSFTTYRGATAQRLAKLNTAGTLDSTFTQSTGFDGDVNALAMSGSTLFIGGAFFTYRGEAAQYLVPIDSTSGDRNASLHASFGSPSALVKALVISGSSIYIGGNFQGIKGKSARRIAKVSLAGSLDTTFNPTTGSNGTNASVASISIEGDSIYIGGSFTQYRGQVANYIAKLDSLGNLDTTFSPATGQNGTNGAVSALTFCNSKLYVTGAFTQVRGETVSYWAPLTTLGELADSFNQSTFIGESVTTSVLACVNDQIYLGGNFGGFGEYGLSNFLTLTSQ